MHELERVQQLGDQALIEELIRSTKHDRQLTVRMLAELGEMRARGLYRDMGFSTMFDYATRKLGMSEAEAALRLRAARLGRAFPITLEMLGRSELNLTTLSLLAPVLTPNTLHLLADVRFKSKQRVLELIAKHAPKPDVPDSIRKLPRPSVRAPQVQMAAQSSAATGDGQRALLLSTAPSAARDPATSSTATGAAHDPALLAITPTIGESPAILSPASCVARDLSPLSTPPTDRQTSALPSAWEARSGSVSRVPDRTTRRSDSEIPLSDDRHRITFTASQRVRDMLKLAQDLRSHRYPDRKFEPLFERALELLIADEQRRRFGRSDRPRTPSTIAAGDDARTPRKATRTECGHTMPKTTRTDESSTAEDAARSDPRQTALDVSRTSQTPTTSPSTRSDPRQTALDMSRTSQAPTTSPSTRADPRQTALDVSRTSETPTTLTAAHADAMQRATTAAGARTRSRHISNAVRRQVWARDSGRCSFHGPDNLRCEARTLLEFHHVLPFARAGAHTVDNIVVLCRTHNVLLAERDYGREVMQARIASAKRPTVATHP